MRARSDRLHKEQQCPLAAPGSTTSPTTSSGRTPPSSSRAWRPMASSSLEEMDRACEKLRARQGEAGSRQGLVRGMARARRSDREARRRGAGQGPQDHRRRLLPARRHLSLQRRTLHRAEPGEEGAVRARLQGLAPGHPAAPSQRRVRRSALRGHHPARAVHEGADAPARRRPWSWSTAWTTPRR